MKNKKIVLFDIDYTLFDTDSFKNTNLQKHSVYQEVHEVLDDLSKCAKLGIFSEGQLEFQKNKLIKTGIKKYFGEEYIHIVEKKDIELENILLKYQGHLIILIDDKLTVLRDAKNILSSVYTIWVKRGIYAKVQKPIENFVPYATIDNLKDLISIVKSI